MSWYAIKKLLLTQKKTRKLILVHGFCVIYQKLWCCLHHGINHYLWLLFLCSFTLHSAGICLQLMSSACGRRIKCSTKLNFSDVQRLQKRKRWVVTTSVHVSHHVTQILLLVLSSFVCFNSCNPVYPFRSNVVFLYVNDELHYGDCLQCFGAATVVSRKSITHV